MNSNAVAAIFVCLVLAAVAASLPAKQITLPPAMSILPLGPARMHAGTTKVRHLPFYRLHQL